MKRFCFFSVACLLLAAPVSRAQDGATPLPPASAGASPDATDNSAANNAAAIARREEAAENYNSLKGHIEDLMAAQADQQKQIQELRKGIEDLRAQIAKPSGNYASQEDLKQLAAAVDDLNKKREADKDLILKEMEKLGHVVADVPLSRPARTAVPRPDTGTTSTSAAAANSDQNGFYYQVKKDDTLSLIAQAYREQKGIKITTKQILDANPNLNPAKLHVGQKIFIPAPQK